MIEHLALFNTLNSVVDFDSIKVPLPKQDLVLVGGAIEALNTRELPSVQMYTIYRFAKILGLESLNANVSDVAYTPIRLDLDTLVKTNFVLKNYDIDALVFS